MLKYKNTKSKTCELFNDEIWNCHSIFVLTTSVTSIISISHLVARIISIRSSTP